ncbi:MAG: ATP-grasp domain-containing protein [Clostridia bacterium]
MKKITKSKVIMFGMPSTEHDISIITACLFENANYKKIYIDKSNKWWLIENSLTPKQYTNCSGIPCIILPNSKFLYKIKGNRLKKLFEIDLALLAFHGGSGENGDIQGLLEIADIPYVSPSSSLSHVCYDKYLTKLVLASSGLNVVEYELIRKQDYLTNCQNVVQTVESKFAYPLIVKPTKQGSSIGVSKVENRTQLLKAIETAMFYDEFVLVEKFVCAQEINVAVMRYLDGYIVSCLEQPLKNQEVFSFADKYLAQGGKFTSPILNEHSKEEEISNLALKIATSLNASGVMRIDLLIEDKIYVNEINTIPGNLAYHLFANKYTKTEFVEMLGKQAKIENIKKHSLVNSYQTSVLEANSFAKTKLKK